MQFGSLEAMRRRLVRCRMCPRLVQFRERVMPKKKALCEEGYWRRPVPGFGDKNAWLLILGLAPSAEGGNRTGRIFTGDSSAKFLFRTLYKEGFASKPFSESREDGLRMKGCYLTASVKCVPPQNRPLKRECDNCSVYLMHEMRLLKKLTRVLVLGHVALHMYMHYMKTQGADIQKIAFGHGRKYTFADFPVLYLSYHPSPQNTHTGKLTEKMFSQIFKQIKGDQGL